MYALKTFKYNKAKKPFIFFLQYWYIPYLNYVTLLSIVVFFPLSFYLLRRLLHKPMLGFFFIKIKFQLQDFGLLPCDNAKEVI